MDLKFIEASEMQRIAAQLTHIFPGYSWQDTPAPNDPYGSRGNNVSGHTLIEGQQYLCNLISMASMSGPTLDMIVEVYEHESWVDDAHIGHAGNRLYKASKGLVSWHYKHHIDRYSTFLKVGFPLNTMGTSSAKLRTMNSLVQRIVPTLKELLETDAKSQLKLIHLDAFVQGILSFLPIDQMVTICNE